MGNKKKLIKRGLVDLFPININCFVDLFAGSSIVALNAKANRFIVNDIDSHLYDLYSMFRLYSPEQIISHIEKQINRFGLARERTKRNEYHDKDKIAQYKEAYMSFRKYYNAQTTPDILDFYTLMFYSFSQQFRFNNKGQFNMPCGNDCFAEKNKTYIINGCDFFGRTNVELLNKDFRKVQIDRLNPNDFVYLDPPYMNATATYNENNAWNEKDEDDLYVLCDELTEKNIRFAMSNVFKNKGVINDKLITWVSDKRFNVYTFNKFSYMACGKGNSDATEVLITNYNIA